MPRVFISCVTAEFGACRVEIARYFEKVRDCEVESQEKFCQVADDTIQKLYDFIKDCDAVVHIIGEGAGAIADSKAVTSFLERNPAFAARMKEVGDFMNLQISYTQWEVFLAAFCNIIRPDRNIPIFVYQASAPIRDGHPTKASGFPEDSPVFEAPDGDTDLVKQHCARLKLLPTRRYPSLFKDRADLYGQFISDLHVILGARAHASIMLHERFGPHKVDELRNLLQTAGGPLLKEGYLLAAFVQFTAEIPDVSQDRGLDFALVDVLAERRSPHDLLAFAKACAIRCKTLSLEELSFALDSWFLGALNAFNSIQRASCGDNTKIQNADLTETAVMGRCGEALSILRRDGLPKPTLEIAWRQDAVASGKQVFPEAYIRWGRYCKQVSLGSLVPTTADEGLNRLVRSVRSSKQFQHVRFDRLDIFVSRGELTQPWEYKAGCKPDDDDPQLLPWPSVVRLLGRELVFTENKPPPDPVTRQSLACHSGQCETFLAEVRERGAFFAARTQEEDAASVFGRAAARASLGFWIRTPKPPELIEECLSALEGLAFEAIPLLVSEWKLYSPKHSAWREITVLYDHPEWPAFEFYEDQYLLSDIDQTNRSL